MGKVVRVKPEPGDRVGFMTFVADAGRIKNRRVWRVRCECGKEVVKDRGNILYGRQRSCGCLRFKRASLTGERFGKLVVGEFVDRSKRSGTLRWNCECDCGGSKVAESSLLRTGKIVDCGCGLRDRQVAASMQANKAMGRV